MPGSPSPPINIHRAFIWSVTDLEQAVYKHSEYGRVIPPLTWPRRLDCVHESTMDQVLQVAANLPEYLESRGPMLEHATVESFWNPPITLSGLRFTIRTPWLEPAGGAFPHGLAQ